MAMSLGPAALAQVPDWVSALGGAGTNGSAGAAVAVDQAGKATVAGWFRGPITLGQTTLTSAGSEDAWVSRYNSSGQVQWARQAGGAGQDGAAAAVVDSLANTYVAGYFQGTFTFGAYSAVSRGGRDVFVAKLDASGTVQWLRSGGGPGEDYGAALALDRQGRVYLAGQFQREMSLGPATVSTPGAGAAFLARLDAQGNVDGIRSLGAGRATGVAWADNHVYVCGEFTALVPGSAPVFLAALDMTGALRWYRPGVGTEATAVAAAAGRVVVGGRFAGSLPASTATLVSAGRYDGFVLQYDAAGNEQWAAQTGGAEEDCCHSLALSPDGAVWTTGYYRGAATFGSQVLQSGPACVAGFVTHYSPLGALQWVRTVAGTVASHGGAIAANATGGWVTGAYEGTAAFGGLPPLISSCAAELFVAQLGTTFPDLVVSDPRDVTGSYRNVTVTGTGVATLTGTLQVTGSLLVQGGGVLDTRAQALTGPGSFQLDAGGELRIGAPDGIAATGAAGAVRVSGNRSYSSGASYVYNGSTRQLSGPGLPASIRTLTVDNAAGLDLSAGVGITQLLRLRTGDMGVNGQTLTLCSTSAGTALVDNRGGQVRGAAIVQRYIEPGTNPGPGYRHLAPPVQATTVSDLSTPAASPVVNAAYNSSPAPNAVQPYPTVFAYDETRLSSSPAVGIDEFSKGWVSPAALSAVLEPMRGYSVQMPAQTVDFVGTLTSGAVSRVLTRGPQADAGWHLLGNPYPAPIDWTRVAVPAGLDNAVYVFRSSGPYAGQYRSYINGVGDPRLPLGQGFLVRVSTPGSTVALTLTDNARLTEFSSAPLYYRPAPDARPLVQLSLDDAQGGGIDETTVYFEPGATAAFDPRYDALKVPPPAATRGQLATRTQDGYAAAINGLPALGQEVVVPISIVVPQAGTYLLRSPGLQALPTARVELLDAETGTVVDLRQGGGYAVKLAAGAEARRFALRIRAGAPILTRAGRVR
jgi:hypothetical protein